MKLNSIHNEIINQLIESCINYDVKSFIPFLSKEEVDTNMLDKEKFYNFFEVMIENTKQSSFGRLNCKIELEEDTHKSKSYFLDFYDKLHQYSRLSFKIIENKNSIFINIYPF